MEGHFLVPLLLFVLFAALILRGSLCPWAVVTPTPISNTSPVGDRKEVMGTMALPGISPVLSPPAMGSLSGGCFSAASFKADSKAAVEREQGQVPLPAAPGSSPHIW